MPVALDGDAGDELADPTAGQAEPLAIARWLSGAPAATDAT
jgi:hypothetical protein